MKHPLRMMMFWAILGLSLFHWGMAANALWRPGCPVPWFHFATIAAATTYTAASSLKGSNS